MTSLNPLPTLLRPSNSFGAALAFVILHSSFVILFAAQPPELTILRQQYDKVVAERVTAVFEANKAALDAKFTTALDNAIATAKASGDLPAVLAIQEDKKAIEAKQDLPADTDSTPAALKTLRAIYREQIAKLTEQRTANTTALLTPYAAKLQALEATLTKADRVDEAKEVMDYRVGLKADATPQPPAMAATPAAATPPTTLQAVAAAPQVKGDDRKAAEWVLSVGGTVRLWDNATGIMVYSADKLPKGKFSIRGINLDNNNGGIKPFTDADLAVLAGLERLDTIGINRTSITAAAFDTLCTCPKLTNIMIQYNGLGDALWEHLAASPSLQKISQGYDKLLVTGVGISKLNQSQMIYLSLNCPIVDEALPEIATFQNLEALNLDGSKITDEGVKQLAALKKLSTLIVRGTSVTTAGLTALKGLPLIKLGYGKDMAQVVQEAEQVALLFPKVETLQLPRDINPTPDELAAITKAWPKLKRLEVNSRNFNDTACEGMLQISSLEELDIMYSPITDAGISKLATLKKLFWLNLNEAKITDAALETLASMKALKKIKLPKPGNGITADGLAKFKKKRPDVTVE